MMRTKQPLARYLLLPLAVVVLAANVFSDEAFNRLLRAENWSEAVRHADEKLPHADRTAAVWAGIGLAHEKMNAHERALACYLVGMRLDDNNHDILLGAARVYNHMKQHDQALEMAQKAMSIRQSGESSWEFARASIALGKANDAKRALERVVETDAGNVVANRELGRIYYEEKDFSRALPLMKRSLAGQADSQLALNIALAHKQLGQIDSAIAYFNRAASDRSSPRPEVLVELGRLHYERGDHRNAALNFEKANRNLLTGDDLFAWAVSLEKTNAEAGAVTNAYVAAVAKFGNATTPNALVSREKVGRAHIARRAWREADAALQPLHRADPDGRTVPDILLLMAQVAEGMGNNQAAIGHLERAIARDRNNVEAYARLADLYRKAGQETRARTTYDRLVALDPNNPAIHIALGDYNLKAQKYSDALGNYQRAFALQSSSEAAVGMMNSAWHLRRYDVARDAAESALHREPGLKEPQLMLVKIHMAQKNYSAARNVLLPLLRTETNNLDLWKALAECSENLNDAQSLSDADKRIIELDPRNIPSRIRVARNAERANDLKTAYEVLTQLAALQPRDSDIQRSLYEIATKQNNRQAAITHLRAFLALKPNDAAGHRDLGNLQFAANDHTNALASYRAAVRADSKITGLYQNYAAILMRNNTPAAELLPVLIAAVEANEANEAILTAAGNELQKQEQWARAAEMFQKAIALNGRNLANQSALALCLERSGKTVEAISAYEQVTMQNPNATREFKALGDLYLRQRNMPQAVAAYKKYLEKTPTDAVTARVVGDHEFAQKNWAEANKYYAMVSGAEAAKPEYLRNYGTSLFEAKNNRLAEEIFKRLSDANPRDTGALKKLYEIQVLNRNTAGALANLQKYVALVPNDAAMQKTLGDMHFDAQNRTGALAAYRAALRLDPSLRGLHKRFVELLRSTNAPAAEEIPALNAAISANEADAAMFERLGNLHRAANNCRAAIPALERASQLDNRNTAVLSAIADCHVKNGDIPKAIQTLEMVTTMNPNATNEFKMLGDLYVQQRKPADAVRAYKKFLEKGTDDAAARLVGEEAFKAQNWAEAVRYLGMVKGNVITTAPFLEMMGRAAFENKDNQRAITAYRQLSTANPNNADYVKMLYELAVRMGAREEIVTHLRKYVQLRPNDADMQKALGDLLYDRRDRTGALAAYRAALTANPQTKGFHRRIVELVEANNGAPQERIAAMEAAAAAGESDAAMLVKLGNIYIEQKQPAKAVPLFERAVREDARNSQLLLALARSQEAAGMIDQAIVSYNQYVLVDPRASAQWKTLGDLYTRQRKNNEAIAAYKKYLEANRTDVAIALLVAKHEYAAKNWAEAVKYFALVSGDEAKKPENLKMYGTAAFEARDNPRALTVLQELIRATPRDADVLKMLEEVCRRTNANEQAVTYLKQYAALRPNDVEANRRLGDLLYDRKDEPGALAAYRAVLRADPAAKGFHKRHVELVMKSGTEAEKLAALNAAIAANEADVGMFIALGRLHKAKNEFAKAAEMFESASKLQPSNAEIIGELADCQLRMGNLTAAAQNLQQAIVLNPRAVNEYKTLGDLYMQQRRPNEAIDAYKKFLERAPGDSAIALIVGNHAFEQRQWADAFKFLSMVKGNTTPNFLFRLGRSAHEARDSKAAIDALERFVTVTRGARPPNPNRAEALRALAAAYERERNVDRAASIIEELLRGPPPVRDADLAFRRAMLVHGKNPDAAVRIFEENTSHYPRDHRNFLRAGLYHAGKRNGTKAIQMLEKCVALNDTISRAWYELGLQYGTARRDRDMLRAFQKFIGVESQNADAISRVGEYLLVTRNMANDAMVYLEMANALKANDPKIMSMLARGYMAIGKTDEGIRLLERMVRGTRGAPVDIEIRIALADGYLSLGRNMEAATEWKIVTDQKREPGYLIKYATALLGMNRNSEALNIANEVMRTQSENVEALMLSGRVRVAMRNYEDAIDAFRKVGMINPNHADAIYERANVLRLQQKFDEAKAFFDRALRIDPKHALSELGLARIARTQGNQQEYQRRLTNARNLDPNNREIQEELRQLQQRGNR